MGVMDLISKINRTKEIDVPTGIDAEALQLAILEIAAEAWRFEQVMKNALLRMDVMEAERFSRQYRYFSSKVDRAVASAGLKVLDLCGQMYNVGLPVQAMNIESFDEEDTLIITRMIEPVIMLDGRVIKSGMVMVDRVQTD